jgi:hypothetical protein
MPVSAEMYQKAVSAVKSGSAPDDVLDGLMDIIEEYESAKPQASPATTGGRTNFGEGGSILGTGPTGMDMLESKIATGEQHEQQEMARAANPKVAMALNLSSMAQPVIPDETESEKNDRLLEYKEKYFDDNLPTASKRKDLAAPPEFHVQPAPPPQEGITNPLDAFTSSVSRARSNLPAYVPGGKVEHYLEPPLSQFKREMAQTIGPRVADMTVQDPEFLEYADQLWQKIYKQAEAEGRSVVRTAYKENKNWRDTVEGVGAEAIGALAGAARGVDEAGFGGMVSRAAAGATALAGGNYKDQLENYERLGESSQAARFAGQIYGGATPIGLGRLAAGAVGKALPAAAGYAGAAARGAGMAAAEGAGATTSMAGAEGRLPSGGELALGGGLGIPFGLVGGLHGHNLRETTALGAVERAGVGETSLLSGVRPTARGRAIEERSRALTGQSGRAVDTLSKELEEPLATAARKMQQGSKKELGAIQEEYFNTTANDRKPIGSLVKDAIDLRKGLTTPDGKAIPKKGDNLKYLDKLLDETTESVDIVPAADGSALVPKSKPGVIDLTAEEAKRAGIDVEHQMAGYLKSGQKAPGDFVVRVTPRELNANEMEKFKGQMDLELRMGDNPNKQELNPLMRSAREVRDQYGSAGPIPEDISATVDTGTEQIRLGGFSAFQRQAEEQTATIERKLAMAHLPEKVPEKLGGGDAERFQSHIAGHQRAGRSPDVDAILTELAGLSGQSKKLQDVPGMRGLGELGGGIPFSRKSLFEAGRLRLDPMLQYFGPAMGAAMPGALQRFTGNQPLPPQMSPEELEKQKRMMGGMGPFQF